MTSAGTAESVGPIRERLLQAGWSLGATGRRSKRTNLVLQTRRAILEIDHMRDSWMVVLCLASGDERRRIEIEANPQLERFLELLIAHQRDLSPETWPSFTEALRSAGCIPGAFSTYLLELADGAGGPFDLAFAATEPDTIAEMIDDVLSFNDLEGLTSGFRIWIVQRGLVTRSVDVYPMLTAHFRDGSQRRFIAEHHESIHAAADELSDLSFDRTALSRALGAPLLPPLLEGTRLACLRFEGPHPDPDVCSNLVAGQRLHRGYQDLSSRVEVEDIRRQDAGLISRSLHGLPVGLDELDGDFSPAELRARGWEL
jgi:hypothetical protein